MKLRLPLSVGKDRLIFTFHAVQGLFPCLRSGDRKLQMWAAIANYRGGQRSQTTVGEFPVRGARFETAPTVLLGVGALCKRACSENLLTKYQNYVKIRVNLLPHIF